MVYATGKTILLGLLTAAVWVVPAHAEHASQIPNFGFGNGSPAAPPVVNDGKSLSLPGNGAKPPAAAANPSLPPPVEGTALQNDFRVTGIGYARPSTASDGGAPFAQGYNSPARAFAPRQLVPFEGRIGLSRVPQGALSEGPSLAVK